METRKLLKYSMQLAMLGQLVRHARDGKLYLYDVLRTKKETSRPLEQ